MMSLAVKTTKSNWFAIHFVSKGCFLAFVDAGKDRKNVMFWVEWFERLNWHTTSLEESLSSFSNIVKMFVNRFFYGVYRVIH